MVSPGTYAYLPLDHDAGHDCHGMNIIYGPGPSHEQAVGAQAAEAGADAELAQVLWQLGCVLSEQARWADAQVHLQRSLALLESLEHCNALDIACVCNGAICNPEHPLQAQATHFQCSHIRPFKMLLLCHSLHAPAAGLQAACRITMMECTLSLCSCCRSLQGLCMQPWRWCTTSWVSWSSHKTYTQEPMTSRSDKHTFLLAILASIYQESGHICK